MNNPVIPEHLAWHLFVTLLAVWTWDLHVLLGQAGRLSVSQIIRDSWLSIPMALTAAVLVFLHFVNRQ